MTPPLRHHRSALAALIMTAFSLVVACSPVGTDGVVLTHVIEDGRVHDIDLVGLVPSIPVVTMPSGRVIRESHAAAKANLADADGVTCGAKTLAVRSRGAAFSIDASAPGSTVYAEASADVRRSQTFDSTGVSELFDGSSEREISVRFNPDGSSSFLVDAADATASVTAHQTGSAELYVQTVDDFYTVFARADGSGEYYFSHDDRTVTVWSDGHGRWQVSRTLVGRSISLSVEADGSGVYVEGGPHPLRFVFGPGEIDLVAPSFAIEGAFPDLRPLAFEPGCVVVLEPKVLFDFGSAVLRPEAGDVLASFVASVNDRNQPFEVHGHTDAIGTQEANLALSQQRADAVAEALRVRGLSHLVAIGFGETRPLAPNQNDDGSDNPDGRERNRRVEIRTDAFAENAGNAEVAS